MCTSYVTVARFCFPLQSLGFLGQVLLHLYEGPSNFGSLTKAPFSSVLLFFITQLQGIAALLKPQYCLGKATY